MDTTATDIDDYLAALPDEPRATLEQLRRTISAAAPGAVESIGYGMPAFKYRGRPLVYFAAAKNHCALYGTSDGTIRFPPGEPPPAARLQALIAERITAIEAAASARTRKKPRAGMSA